MEGATCEVGGEPSKCVVFRKAREESVSRKGKCPDVSKAAARSHNMSSENDH